jgi:hypothetical protein
LVDSGPVRIDIMVAAEKALGWYEEFMLKIELEEDQQYISAHLSG